MALYFVILCHYVMHYPVGFLNKLLNKITIKSQLVEFFIYYLVEICIFVYFFRATCDRFVGVFAGGY